MSVGDRERTQSVFDDLIVLRGTQQHADRRALVRLAYIAVQGFKIELQLAKVFGLKFTDFQFDRDQTLQLR